MPVYLTCYKMIEQTRLIREKIQKNKRKKDFEKNKEEMQTLLQHKVHMIIILLTSTKNSMLMELDLCMKHSSCTVPPGIQSKKLETDFQKLEAINSRIASLDSKE